MNRIIFISTFLLIISCEEPINKAEQEVLADFSWQIDGLNFQTVYFNNTSKNATHFSWDFGNGDTSNLDNPIYTYENGGEYNVSLIAYGINHKQDTLRRTVEIVTPPTSPLFQLHGDGSKKWKLYREGAAASLGPNPSEPEKWWEGFYNDGSRSCLYQHEFTFKSDKSFEFEDYDQFWGDAQIWTPEDSVYESCFEPTERNMIANDIDLRDWLSGVYSYDFDHSSEMLILNGKGAWMGFPFLGTTSNHGTDMPDSVAFLVNIERGANFDLMTINFDHEEEGFWTFRYVHYDDWQDEPPLVE